MGDEEEDARGAEGGEGGGGEGCVEVEDGEEGEEGEEGRGGGSGGEEVHGGVRWVVGVVVEEEATRFVDLAASRVMCSRCFVVACL